MFIYQQKLSFYAVPLVRFMPLSICKHSNIEYITASDREVSDKEFIHLLEVTESLHNN